MMALNTGHAGLLYNHLKFDCRKVCYNNRFFHNESPSCSIRSCLTPPTVGGLTTDITPETDPPVVRIGETALIDKQYRSSNDHL